MCVCVEGGRENKREMRRGERERPIENENEGLPETERTRERKSE